MSFGAADGRVVIDTHLNNDGFVRGVKGLRGQLGGLQGVVSKLGGIIAGAFAISTLVNFGRECVELGSNVAEVQNVVNVAFGDMTDKVEQFADAAIEKFGMSELAAKKTASTYMAMAKGMGVAEDAASDMAISLAGLTGDVASFYNISQAMADTKLKSVFTGETESLKELGVVMTQANLQAYALRQGITKEISSMTQAEQVALRYGFVMDALSLAQGDFARTADGWANQTRVLSMLWEEFMSIVGQTIITVLTPLVKVANQIVTSLISVANTVNTVVSSLFGGADKQIQQTAKNAAGVGDAISGAVDNQNALTEATKETAKAQEGVLAGFDEIEKLGGEKTTAIAVDTSGAAASVEGTMTITEVEVDAISVDDTIAAYFERLKDAFQPTIDALGRLKEAAAPLTEKFFEGLRWALDNIFVPFAAWVGSEALPAFLDVLAGACDLLCAAIDFLSPGAQWLWDNFLQPIAAWTGGVIVTVLTDFADLLRDIAGLISGEISFSEFISSLTPVQTAILGIATAIGAISIANAAGKGLNSILTFISGVKDGHGIIGKLYEVFALTAGGAGTLQESIKAVFGPGSIIAGIAGIIGGAVITITNFAGMLKDGFSWAQEALMLVGIAITAVGAIILGAPALVAGVIAAIVAAVATAVIVVKDNWAEIKEFFVESWAKIQDTWRGVSEWFNTTVVQPVATFFGNLVTGIKNGAGTLAQWMKDKVVSPIVDLFKGMYNSVVGIVEGLINGFVGVINKFIGGINGVVTTINKIPGVDLPELKTMPTAKIPKLASGTVVPRNREFLAVLGDNKQETEIVSPLSTMKQALLEALQEAGGIGGGDITVELILDGEKVATKLVRRINNMTQRAGKPVLFY